MQKNDFCDLDDVKRQTIEAVADLIERYIEREGIRKPEFARRAGVSLRVIQEILSRGKGYRTPNPTLETLQAIYRVLGIEDWLGGKLD